MKLQVFTCLTILFLSCGDSGTRIVTDDSHSKPAVDPFGDLDPNYENTKAESSSLPTEKWYGLDSDDDTVIYEKDGKILTSGYVTGTFERLDRNDFMHYVVRDSNGYLHSFFIYVENQRQMDKYYEGYEPARGHPVTVRWIRGPLRVSDGGAMQTVYQAKEIIE